MKILLIECAGTNLRTDLPFDSEGFSAFCEQEKAADIAPVSVTRHDASGYKIYTGTSRAAMETAEALFSYEQPPESTPLLNDVPFRAFRDTGKQHPLWLWRWMGGIQWRLGSRRQPEARKATKQRAEALIDQIEREGMDCVLIARGLYLKTLRDMLYRRGYCIQGGGMRIRPLDRIRATKQTLHCGGCIHNCMLDNPGCGIGRLKSKERGISG